MRVIALLCLLFGFVIQPLLDGQVFTHAVLGIVCGCVALACGLASAREDPPHRWEGRIMAILGVALGVWCLISLPGTYERQKRFNERSRQAEREHGRR
jgi:peptidoglycan/LPS O-acetylase OafA/YrhL